MVNSMVNTDYFLEVAKKGIPKMSPVSKEYRDWWKEQRRRCVEGYVVGGVWMPGRLYWHLNFWYIEQNPSGNQRKAKGLPTLRDIDWEIFTNIELCKGLSSIDSFGVPVYENKIKGFMLVGSRDFGKSVIGSSNVGYEYTFFKDNEIVVSGYEEKYTAPLLDKVRTGLNSLPGEVTWYEDYFPAPFSHTRFKDDWKTEVRSGRYVTIGGRKVFKGYNSRILHRVYSNNPMAANGLRPSFHVFEEVGAFNNLKESYNSSIPCWMNGSEQFGMPYLVGTGGDMSKGSVEAMELFYNPDKFNLFEIPNEYDKSGKIAFFVPATKAMNQFRDKKGVVDEEKAREFLMDRRARKKGEKVSYEKELMYYPLEPKEAFLVTSGNIFPRYLLEEQLTFLVSNTKAANFGIRGKFYTDKDGNIKFREDNYLMEVPFPHRENEKTEGCVVIYEHPQPDEDGRIPAGLYVAGCDPYDQDSADSSVSLGSVFVYKRFWEAGRSHDYIVAEYTGRPERAVDFYEVCRMMATYYGAKILYENMVKGLKQYFEMKFCLYLLKEQPSDLIRDIVPDSKVERTYGVHMTKEIKAYIILLIRDWLLEESGPGKFNTQKLFSINLIKELIYYNDKGNFDRVIAFGLTLLHKQALHKRIVLDSQEASKNSLFSEWFQRDGWTK